MTEFERKRLRLAQERNSIAQRAVQAVCRHPIWRKTGLVQQRINRSPVAQRRCAVCGFEKMNGISV